MESKHTKLVKWVNITTAILLVIMLTYWIIATLGYYLVFDKLGLELSLSRVAAANLPLLWLIITVSIVICLIALFIKSRVRNANNNR